MTDQPTDQPTDRVEPKRRHRIWALHMPFTKSGFPVVGSFGRELRGVLIIEADTWKRLCNENPGLATTEFEVGTND